MTPLITGTVDGRPVIVGRGSTALAAAQSAGRPIPTLCHHPGLPPDGNCRLCQAQVDGRLVAACMYPLRADGFAVVTEGEEIREARAFVLEMLVDSCPASPRLLALAAEYGVAPEGRFADAAGSLCVRCGRCVRACEAHGTAAIGFAGRGAGRRVCGPFYAAPGDCIGCLACGQVCPTGEIKYKEEGGRREIWGRVFQLERCQGCGRPFATAGQLARPEFAGLALCPGCRRQGVAAALRSLPPFGR